MILVDSSALIEYYRPGGDPRVRDTVAAAIRDDQVAVNGVVQVEILAFAAGAKEREALRSDFEAFHWVDLGPAEFDLACELGYKLRRRGFTVPATDLIIAASAIEADAHLFHVDAHFQQIEEVSALTATHLAPADDPLGETTAKVEDAADSDS